MGEKGNRCLKTKILSHSEKHYGESRAWEYLCEGVAGEGVWVGSGGLGNVGSSIFSSMLIVSLPENIQAGTSSLLANI